MHLFAYLALLLGACLSLAGCRAASPLESEAFKEAHRQAAAAWEKLPEKDRATLQRTGEELFELLRYLGCRETTAVPPPEQVKSVYVLKWPPTLDFTLQYPLVVRIQLEPQDAAKGHVLFSARRSEDAAPWEITEAWVESKGTKVRQLEVPSAEVQRRMNSELPRWMADEERRPDTKTPYRCPGS